jgi:CBS domain containing-hemolysin-like protein
MTFILLFTLLVLCVSFICSVLEAIFLSITPAYVEIAEKEGWKSAKLLRHHKENIDRPISAILTLNTISHTIGASVIGAMVQKQYGDEFVTITSIILTIAILLLSEILPKVIGASYWKQMAPAAAFVIQAFIFTLFPIVRVSEYIGRLFTRPDNATVTREEMLAHAEIGASEGTLHKKESAIMKNLFMLNNMFVSDIMTPRSVMFALSAEDTIDEVSAKHKPIKFSRIPVYEGSLDHIVGLTFRTKILEALSQDKHGTKIKELCRPINSVPERMTVAAAIDLFIRKKEHLALAVDEYGVVTGIVTLEDAIETLLGVEIVDEFDTITDMRQYALDQWQIRKQQIRRS